MKIHLIKDYDPYLMIHYGNDEEEINGYCQSYCKQVDLTESEKEHIENVIRQFREVQKFLKEKCDEISRRNV